MNLIKGNAGKNKKVKIPTRPYINLTDNDFAKIMHETEKYLNND